MKQNDISNTPSGIMRIFWALCSVCDKLNMDNVVKIVATDEKISTVSCNSCGETNSVLMFTLTVPDNYTRDGENDIENGEVDKS